MAPRQNIQGQLASLMAMRRRKQMEGGMPNYLQGPYSGAGPGLSGRSPGAMFKEMGKGAKRIRTIKGRGGPTR